jgi:hypothetical protein
MSCRLRCDRIVDKKFEKLWEQATLVYIKKLFVYFVSEILFEFRLNLVLGPTLWFVR